MTLGASRSRFGHLGDENAVFLSVTGITMLWSGTRANLYTDCTVRITAIVTAVSGADILSFILLPLTVGLSWILRVITDGNDYLVTRFKIIF